MSNIEKKDAVETMGGRYCFAYQSCMLEHAETSERRGVPR